MHKARQRTPPKDEPPRSQLFLLGLLQCKGPSRIADLATEMGVTSPAVTSLVNELVKNGHARRSEHPEDRRVTMIELTAAGRATLGSVQARRRARVAGMLRHFETPEIDVFLKTLTKLIELVPDESDPL